MEMETGYSERTALLLQDDLRPNRIKLKCSGSVESQLTFKNNFRLIRITGDTVESSLPPQNHLGPNKTLLKCSKSKAFIPVNMQF